MMRVPIVVLGLPPTAKTGSGVSSLVDSRPRFFGVENCEEDGWRSVLTAEAMALFLDLAGGRRVSGLRRSCRPLSIRGRADNGVSFEIGFRSLGSKICIDK